MLRSGRLVTARLALAPRSDPPSVARAPSLSKDDACCEGTPPTAFDRGRHSQHLHAVTANLCCGERRARTKLAAGPTPRMRRVRSLRRRRRDPRWPSELWVRRLLSRAATEEVRMIENVDTALTRIA